MENNKSCCCDNDQGGGCKTPGKNKESWMESEVQTAKGNLPKVYTELNMMDILGNWKVRWGIGRMNYKIQPGLYAVGEPDQDSPVLVTANYKLTFDALRKELGGLSLWILVIDTKGINVWCAAGKGTFGTQELVNRINKTGLTEIISHRELILPQLGAPGVCAHEVTRQTGFKVKYGPVKARDIKEFISSGMKASKEMRTVTFKFYDRLVLTPVELVGKLKISVMVFGILFLLNLVAAKQFGYIDFYAYLGSIITGCILTPILLPWIPGRSFAWKGWLLGIIWVMAFNLLNGWPALQTYDLLRASGYLLVLPAVSSACALNFTGASTYTSLSGVVKEMKIAVPLLSVAGGLGVILILIDAFLW